MAASNGARAEINSSAPTSSPNCAARWSADAPLGSLAATLAPPANSRPIVRASFCPVAKSRGVAPLGWTISLLAPLSSSSLVISKRPWCAVKWRGAQPSLFFWSIETPASRNSATRLAFSCKTASCNGVCLSSFSPDKLMPACTKSLTA